MFIYFVVLMCYPAVAAPTSPEATVGGLHSITFTWQSIYADGATYRVTCESNCPSIPDTFDTQVTIDGLMSATKYTLSVVAIINDISSESSGEVTATISELIHIIVR